MSGNVPEPTDTGSTPTPIPRIKITQVFEKLEDVAFKKGDVAAVADHRKTVDEIK